MDKKDSLWYLQPASKWIEALPLGNGRLGAMVYGGTDREIIQIDESGFWSGCPSDNHNRPGTKALMDQIREALLKQDYEEADRLGHEFVGNKNNYGTNMPVGNLIIQMEGMEEKRISDYNRSLSLKDSVAETCFTVDSGRFKRTAFVSNPSQVCVVRFKSMEGKPFCVQIRYEGIETDLLLTEEKKDRYKIEGNAFETLHSNGEAGVHLNGMIHVICEGRQYFKNNTISIDNTSDVILIVDLETNLFKEDTLFRCTNRIEKAFAKGYEKLLHEHLEDVREKYARMDLNLGDDDMSEIPTDERIRLFSEKEEDKDLFALMFKYGRYLLYASSREDSPLPTHMGGIWNDNIYNNIDCTQDMHLDMNLQMQYLLSAQCNLRECYQPAIRYVTDILLPSGRKTAKEAYESNGFVAHVVSNPWGFTSLGWG